MARGADPVTRRELAERFNVVMLTVSKWERAGMPVLKRGRAGKPSYYSESAVRAWLELREETAKNGGAIDFIRERALRERSQRILAEQRYEMLARELVPVHEAEKALTAIVTRVRTRLLALPASEAYKVQSAATLHGLRGVEDVLRDLMDNVLRELAEFEEPKRKKPRRAKVARKKR